MKVLNCIKKLCMTNKQLCDEWCVHKWNMDQYKHMRECKKCGLRQYSSYRNGKQIWCSVVNSGEYIKDN